MKKKVLLLTAVACIFLGGALFSIGKVMGGRGIVFDFTGKGIISDAQFKELTFNDMDYDAFKSVTVDAANCKIYIYSSDNGKYGVDLKLYNYDDDNIQFGVEGDELIIKNSMNGARLSFIYNLFNDDEQYIKLYIPDGGCGFIDVSTANENIVIEDISATGKVSAGTTNARITFSNVSGETLSAVTTNSNVVVEGVTAEELTVTTSNGTAQLSNVQADRLNVKTSNGEVELEGVSGVEALLKTTNAEIALREVYFDGAFEAHTSNGSIKALLYGEDSDYCYELKTSNGSIKLGSDVHGTKYTGGKGQSKLKLNTSNADITVRFDASK